MTWETVRSTPNDGQGFYSRIFDERWLVELGTAKQTDTEVLTVTDFDPPEEHIPSDTVGGATEIEYNINADTFMPVLFRLTVHRHPDTGENNCTTYTIGELKERDITYPGAITSLVDRLLDGPVALPTDGALSRRGGEHE